MKIASVEAIPVRLPWRRAYGTAHGAYPGERAVVRIRSDDGLQGVAEGMTSPHYGETAATVTSIIRSHLAPAIVGKDPRAVEHHVRAMDRAVAGHTMAKAAVDVALHDLVGRALDLPVCVLLGGAPPEEIDLAWPIGMAAPEVMAEEAQQMVERGYRSLKMKIGGRDPALDLEAVARVRQAVGPGVPIRVDANGEYAGKLTVLRAMEAYDLEIIEQPVPAADLEGLAAYAAALDTPVMVDESVTSPGAVVEVIRRRAADVVKTQVRHQGGFRKCRAVAALVEAAGLQLYSEGPIETSLGTAASAHLIAALPSLERTFRPLLGMGIDLFEVDLGVEPLRVHRGVLRMPAGPGLGVDLDEKALARVRID
ncbi:MAG: dipeptide epimerase [Armatimonadetes bacterium]|nr:dipeptide epimerase [Armatimonadota bacterium]